MATKIGAQSSKSHGSRGSCFSLLTTPTSAILVSPDCKGSCNAQNLLPDNNHWISPLPPARVAGEPDFCLREFSTLTGSSTSRAVPGSWFGSIHSTRQRIAPVSWDLFLPRSGDRVRSFGCDLRESYLGLVGGNVHQGMTLLFAPETKLRIGLFALEQAWIRTPK